MTKRSNCDEFYGVPSVRKPFRDQENGDDRTNQKGEQMAVVAIPQTVNTNFKSMTF